ncbi:conjugal transfer protein TraF [Shewanella sp. SM101]|uniref:conjugal transfer protein TraF n=1 Tax=Shewanella TaxID=22 RepID=UPI0002112D97|nr:MULTISPECIES: conjugal transfer protein TraF [Shewanella]AEH16238.1 alkyl hydroperoxide reductase/ Thiol specific antioxidant/ Mal allergen [Shewanella baltica OS117]MCU8008961.1 conjugal transfer protein TraF [Shewanella sp. SM87]MCU8106912.1 conjugal transfer protein TraF [Shewanella sp. SM101]
MADLKRCAIFIAAAMASTAVVAEQASTQSSDNFYKQRERGWYWHELPPKEDIPEKVEPPKPSPVQAEAQTDEPQNSVEAMSVKWFQENLPKAKELALNTGRPEDVKRYLYIQRAAIDRANQFAATYISEQMFDPYLDESLRRPENDVSLQAFKGTQSENQWKLIESIGKKATLIYFFSSNCPYCAKQTPYLIRLAKEYGWTIMPVSIDGGKVPNDDFHVFGDYRVANSEMAQRFDVLATPTLYVTNNTGDYFLLSSGLVGMDSLGERIIALASKEKIISESELNNVKQVRAVYMTDAEAKVNTERVYDDPDYLINKMRNFMLGKPDADTATEDVK